MLWMCAAVAVASATEVEQEWGAALAESLVEYTSHAERTARLTRELGERTADPDAADRIGNALAVLTALDAQGVTDPSRLGTYLRPALHVDPSLRAEAATAARTLLPPPAVPETEVEPDEITFGSAVADVEVVEASPEADEAILTEGLTEYRLRALVRLEGDPWQVEDGSGRVFSPVGFAERVGDWGGLERIEQRKTRGLSTGLGLLAGGALVIGTGISIATLGDPSRGQALAGVGVSVAGAGLAGGGAGVLGLSIGRSKSLARSYTPEEADRWIETHNDALQSELLLEDDAL